MNVGILSGKGGTGKTTISTSLAMVAPRSQYIDCDVEEPNGAIFLKPKLEEKYPVKVLVPRVDLETCNFCGGCARACQFNAIAVVKEDVLLFPEICHHCGACTIACPEGAISEVEREIGLVERDSGGDFIQGTLDIGEPISIPILDELKRNIRPDMFTILDCPPGASCNVVSVLEPCDYCLLVTEPTPFGLHDVKIAVKLVRQMEIPFAIVINKAVDTDRSIHNFCEKEGIEILLELPFSESIARDYSRGVLPIDGNVYWKDQFEGLYEKIKRRIFR